MSYMTFHANGDVNQVVEIDYGMGSPTSFSQGANVRGAQNWTTHLATSTLLSTQQGHLIVILVILLRGNVHSLTFHLCRLAC